MYYSYQLYTGNMGLSYCILRMGNLTGYVHVSVKYELFWKIISIKNAFLNFVLLVGTFWHLCETSEFRVVHGELMLILLVSIKEWTGMVLKEIEQLVSGLVQEMKVNECSENKCCETCGTERDPTGFLMWHISNNPRKQEVSEIRGNRMGANLTVPIPMRDFAKLKILECSTIGEQ